MLLVVCAAIGSTAAGADMYVFWGEGCPHCEDQEPFLRELEARYPELVVHRLEVWREHTHHALFREMAREHGIEAGAVPSTFFAGEVWVGGGPRVERQIEAAVARALTEAEPEAEVPGYELRLPFIGSIDLRVQPLALSTALIGFIDGLNPCSLWVLTLLLGLIIHSGSRGRVVLVGTTFLATTTLIYGGFIAGVFGLLTYVLYFEWIRWVVAVFALVFGALNVKDYFWHGTGPSLVIAERHKPGIYSGLRRLLDPARSGFTLAAATVAMAAGVALVELPCTAGFPVVWSALLAEQGIAGAAFGGLLALYLLTYLSLELLVVGSAVVTLRMRRARALHGRVLKLVGGMIMLALAMVLIVQPALMNRLGGTLLVFLAAIGASAAIILVHEVWSARQR